MEPPKSKSSSKPETEQVEVAQDWRRIDSLPPGPRELFLGALPLTDLAQVYRILELEQIHQSLSTLKFWKDYLIANGFLARRASNTSWLKVWVGTAKADQMMDYLAGRLGDNLYTRRIQTLADAADFLDNLKLEKEDIGEDYEFLSESLRITQDNFKSIDRDLTALGRTQQVVRAALDIRYYQQAVITNYQERPLAILPIYRRIPDPELPEEVKPNSTITWKQFTDSWKALPVDDWRLYLALDYLSNVHITVSYPGHEDLFENALPVDDPENVRAMKQIRNLVLDILEIYGKLLHDYDYGDLFVENEFKASYMIKIENDQPVFYLVPRIRIGESLDFIAPAIALELFIKDDIHSLNDKPLDITITGLWLEKGPFVLAEKGRKVIKVNGYKLYGKYV